MSVIICTRVLMITLLVYDVTAQSALISRPKKKPEELDFSFRYMRIVPKIIPYAPNDLLSVKFKEKEAEYGNDLTVLDTVLRPKVSFNDSDDSRESDSLYTLMYVNVDAGSPCNLQWLVTNIVGDGYPSKGKQTVPYEYFDAPPPRVYRMVFLVYRHPTKTPIDFFPQDFLDDGSDRSTFNIRDFTRMYNLTDYPVAGNYFKLMPRLLFADQPLFPADWMIPFLDEWKQKDHREQLP